MARRYTSRFDSGIAIDELSKLVNDLRRSDRDAARAVGRGFRKSAVFVQRAAWANQAAQKHPRTPKAKGAISRFANQKSAGLILRSHAQGRYPWAAPMEFGGNTAYLWGRKVPQKSLAERQFKPWVGNQNTINRRSGYVVQPAIIDNLDYVANTVGDDVLKAIADQIGATLR